MSYHDTAFTDERDTNPKPDPSGEQLTWKYIKLHFFFFQQNLVFYLGKRLGMVPKSASFKHKNIHLN